MPALLFLIGLIALPLLEIGVFIAVGSQIGIGWTLALVVLSFLLGIVLLRRQGFSTLKAAQAEARAGIVPERQIVHAAMIVMASILLIVPGFITDLFGLLLFLPPFRDLMWNRMRQRIVVRRYPERPASAGNPNAFPAPPEVIDLSQGEFSRQERSTPWSPRDGDENDDKPGGRKPPTLH